MSEGLTKSEAGKLGYLKTGGALQASNRRRSEKARKQYETAPKACRTCGATFSYESRAKTFCDHSCAAQWSNRHRPSRVMGSCFRCSVPISKNRRLCDPCWETHKTSRRATVESARTDRARREALIREKGRRCEICGRVSWQQRPIPLQLDHIDGDSANNKRANLRLLCPNCHAQTPTFAGRNMGNGKNPRNRARRARYYNTLPT